jgi:cleavage and polyadenylation specificity factor subunit 1
VRAFDRDERLVGVAFLDVGVYVSSLRALKNLLVVGDAVKSVWLVAFQEEPFKLVVISKDVRRHAVARADLFFSGATVAVVAGDEDGVLRMYAYDPADPESKNGQELVYKTEFHTHSECRASLTIARRSEEGSAVPQGKLLCGHLDGALSTLTPVDDAAFKRLQLLQGQLVGKIQHVAGLNPRAFRLVHCSRSPSIIG